MYDVYQVRFNDTLNSIADSYNITVDELLNLNNNDISYGNYIVVPNTKSNVFKYKIQKGDNLYAIAKKYDVPVDSIVLLNGLNKDEYIYPGEFLNIPSSNTKVYVTKEGDGIKDILKLTNMDEILSLNDTVYLLPDQVIIYRKEF